MPGGREETFNPDISCIAFSAPGLGGQSLEGGEGLKGEQRGPGTSGQKRELLLD